MAHLIASSLKLLISRQRYGFNVLFDLVSKQA
ncbi:hypothetical protein CCACVL1_12348 [Corchorus capsularis]|uniref:Uncharacterized protein n=1 Tax=Corchorus capsularis TaxID=210143 RepID=A0A1R3IG90_COCAP|nr:hypothetical protein CCACVL1_12348 [Corchorus capsularis]